ncbi:hypothetical protein Slala03_07000 [Streptomyces lavendulae subsp. lavendulae]|nr:hypothetical protein Slala03_07000 [Streptomyces lavendulae subsp. lavendulae]GLV98745.1 hypothetical protein Slala05_23770 [Streptomyces lavendulae subsp. lavendulae]GLX35603.1 hypothetical protein Sros01_16760 [Streptomyces roseochromogenus]
MAVVEGGVQDRTGVRRAAHVEATPDSEFGVVAPDVHVCSPAVLRACGPIDPWSATLTATDCPAGGEVADCERTDT